MAKMGLYLNDILHLSEDEIENSKIELNMHDSENGESFLDRWLSCDDEDKSKGVCKECSYWGWYGKNQKNFSENQWAFSFVRMPADDEWLFVSAARISEIPFDSYAKVEILDRYIPLFGRLVIKCNKGNAYGRYVFNMNKYLNEAIVKEILPCIYSGEVFEGYDRVSLRYERLDDIFTGKIFPTYCEALEKITGVYCLTDTSTGKLYIGSATGEGGVAQRWGNYLKTGHGDNKKLIDLCKNEGMEYFKKNFRFTLLEYFSLSYDPKKVKEREQYWKKCFDTIEHGYNDN